MGILKKIKKSVRKLISPPPVQEVYTYHPSHDVVKDFSEFTGLPVQEIESRIRNYKSLTKKEWEALPSPDFKARSEEFYGRSSHYICDLLYANYTKDAVRRSLDAISPEILKSIRNHPGRKFLEFGGGTGVFCDIVAEMGKDVTYLDIPGQQYEFAKWRFEKYGIPVKMICTKPGVLELQGEYDTIFSNAVLEHLADPVTPTQTLARHLSKGGILVLLVDLTGEEADMPMHRDVDIIGLHKAIAETGLKNVMGLNLFSSIWTRP